MLKKMFKIEKKFTYLYSNVQKKYACFEIYKIALSQTNAV